MQTVRVLIADDDVEQARALGTSLVLHGYACELVRTATAAFSAVVRGACDIVICDVRLGASNDLELLDRVRLADKAVPVIILTTRGTTSGAVDAVKRGAFQYLVRPCDAAAMHAHIEAAVAGAESSRRRTYPGGDAVLHGEIVHESAVMSGLMQTISLVAMSSAPVLIAGESGTGKERVARAIHDRGPRADNAFVAINAAAIPEHLLESELFGHVRGAFTGAAHARPGLFAEADRGTVLLDEIGDMPRILQPKLLRVLQFGEIRPVGSDRIHRVDVRVIAATHRDLETLIREGQFRDDLRYRLNTLMLRVPPLRERRQDIAPLVQQFLMAARGRTLGSPVTSLSDEAMSVLEQADWPGNVRELESAIERLVVLTRTSTIQPADLSFLPTESAAREVGPWPHPQGRHLTIREMNQNYVAWTLAHTRGDKARAAALLGIDVSTLYRRQRSKSEAARTSA